MCIKGLIVFLQGLTEVEVRSVQDIVNTLKEGENNRTVASTKMNTNRWAFYREKHRSSYTIDSFLYPSIRS